jgi:hypothetical protein
VESRSSRSAHLISAGLSLSAIILAMGCNSDPYCQQAISNLRSEKIQLENQYFSLKSRYEADMRRLGQPIPETATAGSGFGQLLEDVQGIPVDQGNESQTPTIIEPTLETDPVGDGLKPTTDAGDSSSYIRSIEVSEFASAGGRPPRLLIRPLDDQGAVIPVAADLRISLLDASTGTAVANQQFSRQQVQSMVEDDPSRIAGIHVNLPSLNGANANNLLAKVQFRNLDGRVFSAETRLSGVPGSNASNGMAGSGSGRNAEQSDVPPIDGLEIEFGDETSLTTPETGNTSTPSRPKWGPGR